MRKSYRHAVLLKAGVSITNTCFSPLLNGVPHRCLQTFSFAQNRLSSLHVNFCARGFNKVMFHKMPPKLRKLLDQQESSKHWNALEMLWSFWILISNSPTTFKDLTVVKPCLFDSKPEFPSLSLWLLLTLNSLEMCKHVFVRAAGEHTKTPSWILRVPTKASTPVESRSRLRTFRSLADSFGLSNRKLHSGLITVFPPGKKRRQRLTPLCNYYDPKINTWTHSVALYTLFSLFIKPF